MIKRIRESLMLKWMVFSIFLAALPLAIAGFNIFQIYQQNLKKSIIEIEKGKAQIVVERTEAFLEKVINNLYLLSRNENYWKGGIPHAEGRLLNYLYSYDFISELSLLDKKGQEMFRVSKYKVYDPSDLKNQSDSEMFGVASKGEIYYGACYLAPDGIPTMSIAIPIETNQEESFAVLSAKVHLKYLWKLLPQTLIGKRGSTYVVNQEGELLAHSGKDPEPNMKYPPMIKQFIEGEKGSIEFKNPQGEKYLGIYKTIEKLGWGVVVQVPLEEAYAPLRQVTNTALKWILVAMGIAIIFSFLLTRKLIYPIKQLSNQMGKVSRGNLDVHITPTTKDELGFLTTSFNQMIQDLKQSQEAFKKAEKKYRRIFEDSKDMLYITSADGKLADVNQAGVDLFGYESKEEMMQVYAKDTFLNREDQKRFMEEVRKKWFVKDFEVKLKRKDGTPIDVLTTVNVRRDDSGKVISYEGIIKDISDRKRMEEELVRRTKELETINEMGALINQTLVDLDTFFPIALEKTMSLTGYEMGAVYLLSEAGDFLEMKYHNGHSPAMVGEAKVLKYGEGVSGQAIISKKPVISFINEYASSRRAPELMKEGIQTLVGFPLMAKGKAIGTITLLSHSLRDLTHREINLLESIGNQIGLALENAKLFSSLAKAKSEWETTFDAVTDIITILDKDYRIIRANKTAFERFGLKPEEMLGKKCFEVLYHNDKPCEGCNASEALRTKKLTSGEREGRPLKGVFQYYDFPIFDEAGEVIGVVDLARDITAQKQKEIEKEVINNVNKILVSSLDVKQVMKAIHSEVKKVLNSDRMTITLIDEEKKGFRYFASDKDYDADENEFVGYVFYPEKGTSLGKVVETGLPSLVPDTGDSDSWPYQKLFKEGIRSSLLFPLEYKGKIIGTMGFGSRETKHFSENQFGFLHSIATGLAIFIQNSLLFEEIKKRLNELTILHEITRISTSSSSLDRMFTEIADTLSSFFKFEKFGVLLIEENTKRLIPHKAFFDENSMKNIEGLDLQLGKGITGWVAEKGEPLLVNDVRKNPRYISIDESVLSEMCVPLKVGQKIIGVIDAYSNKLNAFSEDDLRLFNIAGGQIATAIENIRLQEEIKQSEERYRTVVEGALDGVCIIEGDYRLKFVNKKLADTLGYIREELTGTDFRNYMDEASKRLLTDREEQLKKGVKLSPYFELTIIRKNGDLKNAEIGARIIKDSKGNANIIVILKDVTEKKRMEEQLLQNEKLRALGEMASGVAHDFNNALAAILGNTQLLLYKAKDEELKENLKIIEKVVRKSAQTVRRLQDFTRKKVHQELFAINANILIKDAIEITKPKWKDEVQNRGIHIEIASNLEEIPLVSGNASELREVITNMIFNAIEAMPEGGKIGIRTFQRENKVLIQISDTGIGMTEENKKKAFEPFFTTKPFSNTGLGLSMSYGIIKRFGGEIEVESKIGHGTIFTIILPSSLKEKEEVDLSPMITEAGGVRVLVIDDEETVRNIIFQMLSQVKHQVTIAKNGAEGIRLFREREFDIVLTDLGMPGMSGWEVGKAIKEMSPHTPVGMITGWGMEVDQAKIEENGIDFVIPKPFQFNQIVKVIDETIASKGKPSMT